MKIFDTLGEVLDKRQELNWAGILFTNNAQWQVTPNKAKFVYLEGEDELYDDIADEETMLPRLAADNNVEHFFDMQVFEDVITKQQELKADSSIDDFIHALNYYREYDTFYWPN